MTKKYTSKYESWKRNGMGTVRIEPSFKKKKTENKFDDMLTVVNSGCLDVILWTFWCLYTFQYKKDKVG